MRLKKKKAELKDLFWITLSPKSVGYDPFLRKGLPCEPPEATVLESLSYFP